jgi:hypothetical protein
MKILQFAFIAACIASAVPAAPSFSQSPGPVLSPSGEIIEKVKPGTDPRLSRVEKSDRVFTKLQNKQLKRTSFFYQRMIGEAIVEKDFIRYKFNDETGALIEKQRHWREGLPKRLPQIIPKERPEATVEGEVEFSTLVFIAPDSDVYKIRPTPADPVWVVRTRVNGLRVVAIVDAVTGERLGNGLPPPSPGLSIDGPDWAPNCAGPIWPEHAQSARDWFVTMGYTTDLIGNAYKSDIQGHIQSDDGAVFYELDHGGSTSFHNRCDEGTSANDIQTWIDGWANMPFAFIGSCDGLTNIGAGTFSNEFRKGGSVDTVVVGYHGMSSATCEPTCWPNAIPWQGSLFSHTNAGDTVWAAFGEANLDYPNCAACTRFTGDTSLTLVPVVLRSFSGWLQGFFAPSNRDHHLRGEVVAAGSGLTIQSGTTMVFVNNSVLRANSTLWADSSSGNIRFASEADRTRRIKLTTGQLRMHNDGQMKIH